MKNGKLFGKINIIDLLIILIVLAALAFVGLRYLRPDSTARSAEPDKVRMTFFANDAPILLWDQGERQMGGPVSDYDASNYLGVLTSYEPEEAYLYELNPGSGELLRVRSATECLLTFACEGEGYLSADGLRINGVQYSIGGSYVICAGQTRIACRLADVERID